MTRLETRIVALEKEFAALRDELETERVREGLRLGRQQAAQGKTIPAREFMEKMRMKYKLAPSRSLEGIEKGIRAMHRGDGIPAKNGMELLRKKRRIPAS